VSHSASPGKNNLEKCSHKESPKPGRRVLSKNAFLSRYMTLYRLQRACQQRRALSLYRLGKQHREPEARSAGMGKCGRNEGIASSLAGRGFNTPSGWRLICESNSFPTVSSSVRIKSIRPLAIALPGVSGSPLESEAPLRISQRISLSLPLDVMAPAGRDCGGTGSQRRINSLGTPTSLTTRIMMVSIFVGIVQI
jgi:hypothetical protein